MTAEFDLDIVKALEGKNAEIKSLQTFAFAFELSVMKSIENANQFG